LLRGRRYVLPEDITDLVPDVLRHRLVLSYEALAEGLTADALIERIMKKVPARQAADPQAATATNDRPALADAAPRPHHQPTPRAAAPLEWTVHPPPRRPAAGRLPHAVPRRRRRPGRPARVPAARRRAPHRLERHRAAAAALRAPVHRGPRPHRLVPARPVGQRRLRLGDVTKLAVSAGFVATLARVLTRHGNRVGAMLYGSQVDTVLPPRSQPRGHVLHLLQRMRAPRPAPGNTGRRPKARRTAGRAAAAAAGGVIKRRSLVFVVSDFISEPGWDRRAGAPGARHEVVAVRLFDPLEMALPDVGLVTVEDAETGEQLFIDAADPAFRERYAAIAEQQEAALREALGPPAPTRWSWPPTTTCSTRCCALPTLRRQRAAAEAAGAFRLHAPRQRPDAPAMNNRCRMSFLWPMLWLLLLLPLLVLLYLWLLRRKRKTTVRLASLQVAKEALGKGPGWRRHVPPLLLLLAVARCCWPWRGPPR
jgi:hypothetical protein